MGYSFASFVAGNHPAIYVKQEGGYGLNVICARNVIRLSPRACLHFSS